MKVFILELEKEEVGKKNFFAGSHSRLWQLWQMNGGGSESPSKMYQAGEKEFNSCLTKFFRDQDVIEIDPESRDLGACHAPDCDGNCHRITQLSKGANPAFQGVSLEKFIRLVSDVFDPSRYGKIATTPLELARKMASEPYDSWHGNANLIAITTPFGLGWQYRTISFRKLTWIPGDIVCTEGLQESNEFLEKIEKAFGDAIGNENEERWEEFIRLKRPCYFASQGGDVTFQGADNEEFFSLIFGEEDIPYEENGCLDEEDIPISSTTENLGKLLMEEMEGGRVK